MDEARQVPRFLWASGRQLARAGATPPAAARAHLVRHAAAYRLAPAQVDSLEVAFVHDTGAGGIIVVLRQRSHGVEVYRGEVKVLMARDLALIAISGSPHIPPAAPPRFRLNPDAALAEGLTAHVGAVVAPGDLRDLGASPGGYTRFGLTQPLPIGNAGLLRLETARAKPVLFPEGDALRPAYFLEFFAGVSTSVRTDAFRYLVAADDGRVLEQRNLTVDAQFRVFADGTGRPLDGPIADFTPHPTGTPDGTFPGFVAPVLVTQNGFNQPADPWLAPAATETTGNNVDAYADLSAPDGFSAGDVRATTTTPGVFDRTYNTAVAPLANTSQTMAAVTHLFYVINWMHDWYYDSGFNEAAGNAQVDNYGRGGLGGDPILGEAQDYGGTNNANMSTPADGASPRMQMFPWSGRFGVQFDGDLDSPVVAHEWGHYLHHRLADCGQNQCGGMGEGWGDFVALHLVLRDGDDLDKTYADCIYAAGGLETNAAYFGLRRAPYSVDPTKNNFTFKHIMDGVPMPTGIELNPNGAANSETHNAGEIWAVMMFEAYVALLKQAPVRPFAEVRRLMSDYVVAGLLLVPADATFTEQRDALLAAVWSRDQDDTATLASALAVRGLGSCAVAPPRDSTTNAGVVEGFVVKPRPVLGTVSLVDTPTSCDGDGVLDAGETGTLSVDVANNGHLALTGATLTVSSSTPGVVFPAGMTKPVPDLAAFSATTVTVPVGLSPTFTGMGPLNVQVSVAAAGACATPAASAAFRVNYDETPAASATDDVEATATLWTTGGPDGAAMWARLEVNAPNHVWHGTELSYASDGWLESPPLVVGSSGNLVMSFLHRHTFELGSGNNYDGGLIEITDDAGATWHDLSDFGTTGYGGTIFSGTGADNPLAGRQAYVGVSAGYPSFASRSIDLGASFAGKTVRVRFRMGTDTGNGASPALGWDIDNIGFQGVTSTPFTVIVAQAHSHCATAPVARAGADQRVVQGTAVVLDASGSSDANGDPLTFLWTQTAGPGVTLTGATSAVAGFTAPTVATVTTLTFQVEVSDGGLAATDSVDVVVTPTVECRIGGVYYPPATPNPGNACAFCDTAASTTAWTNRPAGYACPDDGLACTTDACDGAGACQHPLTTGCLIAAACVAAGTADPGNECRDCQPASATTAYTNKAAGVACTDDGDPTTADACDGAGACGHVATDTCFIGGVLYAGGAANPANECATCVSTVSRSAWTNRAAGSACADDGLACTTDTCDAAGACQHALTTGCLIDGACVAAAAADPASECRTCQPDAATDVYTAKPSGTACTDDGLPYTDDACDSAGACVHTTTTDCVIAGVVVASGTANPANECQSCDPTQSQVAWSHRAAGTTCEGDGLSCTADVCDGAGTCDHSLTAGCLIGGACVADGATQAGNACMACQPSASTTAYTAKTTPECRLDSGVGGADGGATGGGSDDSGCSCRAGQAPASTSAALWLGLVLVAAVRRRRPR
jgi:MYXO-CTERM domain-containing protein